MAHASVSIGQIDYAAAVRVGRHTLVSDEPATAGGQDAGPAPYDLLLASLGSCTVITLRMYANRKQWTVRSITADLVYSQQDDRADIQRILTIDGDLDDAQLARMLEIAEKTPVTRTLRAGADIHTRLA